MGKIIPDSVLPEYKKIFSLMTGIPEEETKDLTVEQMNQILEKSGASNG